jgi:DNA-binding response OmpR family regulator
MSGFTVCETVRAGGAPAALPIVMMSVAGGPHAA